MAAIWTPDRMILLETAVSEHGYAWRLFATDPAFGLSNFTATALRLKWSSMAEVGEWSDHDSDSSLDEEEYVNYSGLLGDISSSDESDYLPPENPEVDGYDSDWFNDEADDVEYQPLLADAEILPIADQGGIYNLRERMNGEAVSVPPRSLQELRAAQVPCSWNEDVMQQFAKGIGSRGCNWTAISNDLTLGLPENLTAGALKMKYRSLEERAFWESDADSSSEDDDPVDYVDYAQYVLGPVIIEDIVRRLSQPRPRRGPVAAVPPQVDEVAPVPPNLVEAVGGLLQLEVPPHHPQPPPNQADLLQLEEVAAHHPPLPPPPNQAVGGILQLEEAAAHHPPSPPNPFPYVTVPKRPRTARIPRLPPNA